MSSMVKKIDYALLTVRGRDAKDFLQRLTTVDMRKLSDGLGAKGLLLTGTGRLIAAFVLLQESAEHFSLVAEQPVITALSEALGKLHFAENLEMNVTTGWGYESFGPAELWYSIWPAADHELEREAFPFHREDNELSWPLPIPQATGVFFARGGEHPELHGPDTGERWENLRIQALVPAFGKEWKADQSALDTGLLPWIHRFKGCYPGQEVVERSLNVGHPARFLVQLRAGMKLEVGDSVAADGKNLGTLSSVAPAGSEWVALASLAWSARGRDRLRIQSSGNDKGEALCQRW